MARPASSASKKPQRYVHKLQMHSGAPRQSVDMEEMDLRERIAQLEEQLAAAPYLERKRRETARQLVPADEDIAARHSGQARSLTRLEKRAQARERRRHILISFALVAMLIGLLNWLAHLLRA